MLDTFIGLISNKMHFQQNAVAADDDLSDDAKIRRAENRPADEEEDRNMMGVVLVVWFE